MGHIAVIRKLLDQEAAKSYPYPIGIECKRKPFNCASWHWDRKCYGPACPFFKGNGK